MRRVPVIRQLTSTDCGITCLAMVLTYFGRATRASSLGERWSCGRDGLTARTLLQAAQEEGLDARAFQLESAKIGTMPLPAIAHWNGNHFVVVERWTKTGVDVIDPALGRTRMKPDEFDKNFSGMLLTFRRSDRFQVRRKIDGGSWSGSFAKLLRIGEIRSRLALVLGASMLLLIFGLAIPATMKLVLDWVIPNRAFDVMPLLAWGIVVLAAAQFITGLLRAKLLIYLEGRVDAHLMLGFFEHLLALPFRFFQQRPAGDLMMRLGSNATIRDALTTQTIAAVLDGVMVIGYMAFLLLIAPKFGALAMGVGSVQAAILVGSSPRLRSLVDRELAAGAESQSYLIEALAAMVIVKASGAEQEVLHRWSALFHAHLNASQDRGRLSAVVENAMTSLRVASSLVLVWYGVSQVMDGILTLGTMFSVTAIASSFLAPVASLVTNAQHLLTGRAHLERIAEVTGMKREQENPKTRKQIELMGNIELRDVSFRYGSEGPLVLQGISLRIEPESTIAVVGRSGSGKSTLAKLLAGMYEPTEGDILYDGIPLRQLDLHHLRRQLGVVFQESYLFRDTIRRNIALNDPDLSIGKVVSAASLAVLHDEISRLPMGYETTLEDGGQGLSGGQRQRLSIARALVRMPSVLVLDEATSHLDVLTEEILNNNLQGLPCVKVVIAHRLSTIVNADLILVLDGGQIVEQGTHESLLRRCGHYASLVGRQMKPQSVDEHAEEVQWR